jgi:hypothetical protein
VSKPTNKNPLTTQVEQLEQGDFDVDKDVKPSGKNKITLSHNNSFFDSYVLCNNLLRFGVSLDNLNVKFGDSM